MAWLPDGEKNWKIGLFVLTESTNMTDGRTDRYRMTAKAALDRRRRRRSGIAGAGLSLCARLI